MRWLREIFHARCEREIARQDALIKALLPGYQPVSYPPSLSQSERIERALAKDEPEEMPNPSVRLPEVTVKWKA